MSKKSTTEEFIKRAKAIHGNKYDYSKTEYVNSNTKVCITCHEHGEFWIIPSKHIIRKQGCSFCSKNHHYSNDQWINKAKAVHGNKYDYSKTKYVKDKIKVCIVCPEHGEFWQDPSSHLRGAGCPKCTGKNKTTEEFIAKAKLIHGDKYDYSKAEYKNANTKICIVCPKHGEFWQAPHNHLDSKSGCPVCRESHGEEKIRLFLNNHNIIFEEQKRFTGCRNKRTLPFDFYLPDFNLCIEYQGEQHFKCCDRFGGRYKHDYIVKNDNIKKEWCSKEENPNLLEIMYFDDADNILNALIKDN